MSDEKDFVRVQVTIKVWNSGAMSVEGPIDDKPWMLSALENAKDAVRNHGKPSPILVPPKDVAIVQ